MSAKFRINVPMLLRVTGWLVMIEAAFMIVPVVTACIYGERDLGAFAISAVFTVISGAFMTFGVRPKRFDMGKREGFLLTALVWVVFSLFGMIPFLLCGRPMTVTDAFFEAMSGFTTTGASVMSVDGGISHAIHIWRSLMQWIGGMGIILFTLAVLPMLNSSGGMQMFNAEVTGITHEKLRPRVSSTAKQLWLVYALLTIVLMGLYWLGPMSGFDSVCHAFSTMSTGGFSTRSESIGAWNSLYIKIVTTLFMFLGGVNFAMIFKASTGQLRQVWKNEVFKFYIGAILVLFVLFDVSLFFNGNVEHTVETFTIDPLFQIVSTLSSTGYMVAGFENWGAFILTLVIVMMFFGACAGSTSGGAKIDRAIYMWRNIRNEIYRCVYPNRILAVNVNGRTCPPEIVNKVQVFLCLYVLLILVGGALLTIMDVPLIDSFFSAFACVSNTGLGAGITGYGADIINSAYMGSGSEELLGHAGLSGYGSEYGMIPAAGKWVLSLLMLTGRLEVFTIIVLFTPGFWRS